ncbi:pyrimidine reductase [Companilactobacillus ginsenosidimutans]|uniref:Riboflavin biosynthesis protein RibD n=2 Tax=Companilactobacillus ginsenosidimutans TaxID=1007676 RepID=A0A0H4QKP0_9LACO|nr:pyrimidine reductase [Companilactobacillus ginsenosidimutans]
MNIAFQEAKKGKSTWTNPQVGAVIVKDGKILAQGHHEKFGGPHAEVNTLNKLEYISDAKGADMYVTLEPCSHFGKTPPCVQRVTEVGIKRVFIGMQDPNPIVSGNGIKYLKDHNIEVEVCNDTGDINEAYIFYYQNKRPLITVKYAMSVDGKINKTGHHRTIITGEEAYEDAQKLRSENQAILIGEHTVIIDNPQLTVRNREMDFPPIRVVVVRDVNTVEFGYKIFQNDGIKTLIFSQTKSRRRLPENVEVAVRDDWTPDKIVEELAQRNIESLLVEGGSKLQAEFVHAGLVDKVVTYIAPKLFGGASLPAVQGDYRSSEIDFEETEITKLGSDLKIELRRSK